MKITDLLSALKTGNVSGFQVSKRNDDSVIANTWLLYKSGDFYYFCDSNQKSEPNERYLYSEKELIDETQGIDFKIVLHGQQTVVIPEIGANLQPQLGRGSTLTGMGTGTNFVYEIENTKLTDKQVREINSIDSRSKIKDRIEKIKAFAGRLRFRQTESSIFGNNLVLIDSALPIILAELVFLFFTSGNSRTMDLVDVVSKTNPLGFNLESNHPYYAYKIKRFLTDIALGMMPSKVWTGELEATGGYLVAKEDGEILCYHIYNRNEFEDYLLNNTKLETASSTRHEFGVVYEMDGKQFFNLNLQIRFLK